MCDDLGYVQAALQHDGHLVPGFVHFAAIDALYSEHGKHHRVPIDGHLLFWNAEHGNFCAMTHITEHVAESGRVAGHLEADVESLVHTELLLDLLEILLEWIDGQRNTHFS